MNIKGFIFLICTIFILVLTINYTVNNNHFLVTWKANMTFDDSLHVRNNFIAIEDTLIYLQAFSGKQVSQLEIWIEDKTGPVYTLENVSEKTLEKINLKKGMYSVVIKGEGDKETKINTLIGYYTDEVRFINDENQEES